MTVLKIIRFYTARLTFPALRHFVQTFAFLIVPLSSILTVWILAFHFLLECLFEWETLFPETWPFPQTSHFLDISTTSYFCDFRYHTGRIISQQYAHIQVLFFKIAIYFSCVIIYYTIYDCLNKGVYR